jgi:trypsin
LNIVAKMFKSFVITVAALFAFAGALSFPPKPRLENGVIKNRIVGGFVLPVELAPYQVSLQYGDQHICGGSIISPEWVLTAAHCTDGSKASDLRVRVGTSRRDSGGEVVQVNQIVQNENYDAASVDYDYSLLKLARSISLSAAKQVVQLADANDTLEDGTWSLVSGWGNTQSIFEPSNILRAVAVPVVNQEQCNDDYAEFGGVTDRMLCAGFRAGGRDACQVSETLSSR